MIYNKEFYITMRDYLISKNMAFCWIENGTLITLEDCEAKLKLPEFA